MDVVSGTDDDVAGKDRPYLALDKALEPKRPLERHLDQTWRDLFGAKCDLLLYDLTRYLHPSRTGPYTVHNCIQSSAFVFFAAFCSNPLQFFCEDQRSR
jgi:hypothetical protein